MEIDSELLKKNIYFSQGLTFFIGLGLIKILNYKQGILAWSSIVATRNLATALIYGSIIAALVILLQIALYYLVPHKYLIDDGTNELIYNLSVPDLIIVFLVGSFAEELLFRVALQTGLQVLGTSTLLAILGSSLLFTLLHFRYMTKPVLFLVVLIFGLAFGWLYAVTGTIWGSTYAHFVINFSMACFAKHGWFIPKAESPVSEELEESEPEHGEIL